MHSAKLNAQLASPLAQAMPFGTLVARLGNAIAADRRRGKKPRFVFVGEQLGAQFAGQGRDRVHGLQVIVDARLSGNQVILGGNRAAVEELVAKAQEEAAAKAAEESIS
jgi:hypothetical protein